jgi:hypothetical protein
MKYLKYFENNDLQLNLNRKVAYKKMLLDFQQLLFGLGGIQIKLAFEKKEDLTNKDKFQEIYDFLQTKVKPSFQKDLILDYKWYYSHAKEFTHVVYTTLKYLKGNFSNLNMKKDMKESILKGIEDVSLEYSKFISLY